MRATSCAAGSGPGLTAAAAKSAGDAAHDGGAKPSNAARLVQNNALFMARKQSGKLVFSSESTGREFMDGNGKSLSEARKP